MKKIHSVALKLAAIVAAAVLAGQAVKCYASRSSGKKNSMLEPVAAIPENLIRVPLMRQGLSYTCGPAALASILYYYDKSKEYLETELAKELNSTELDGTLVKDIVRVAESEGYTVKTYYHWNLSGIKSSIDHGVPVMVLMQAWAESQGKPHDYRNDWDNGHFAVVIGYDAQNLYFMDPSTFGNYTYVPIREFLDRWHDVDGRVRVFNFGMTIMKGSPWYDRDQIFKME